MFSFPQISRWLSFSADPLTVEDWLANREVFGPVEKPTDADQEMEKAYSLENERADDGGTKGVYQNADLMLVCARGKGEKAAFEAQWSLGSDKKSKKARVSSVDSLVINSSTGSNLKLNVKCQNGFKIAGKDTFVWQGDLLSKVVIDCVKI